MNDITILQEMLSAGAQVPLKQTATECSVTLRDKQAKTTVEITNLPPDSIVITIVFIVLTLPLNG